MKFLEFTKEMYMVQKPQLGGFMVYEDQEWVQGLKKLGILRLLNIPHFGINPEVNAHVKQLLTCIHGGNLWLDSKVEIRTQLISWITSFLIQGKDLELLFVKESEKVHVPDLYKKYQTK